MVNKHDLSKLDRTVLQSLPITPPGLDPDKFEKHIRGPSKSPSAYKGGRLNYCNSKLLQIFLTNELARRYWDKRDTVQFVSVHPGKKVRGDTSGSYPN